VRTHNADLTLKTEKLEAEEKIHTQESQTIPRHKPNKGRKMRDQSAPEQTKRSTVTFNPVRKAHLPAKTSSPEHTKKAKE
jgi:hypothetical protein